MRWISGAARGGGQYFKIHDYPGGFGSLVKYLALVLHYSGGLLLLRFCVIIIYCALNYLCTVN
jgi:hypothetical protein